MLKKALFKDIFPLWKELWPNRISPIEPVSAIICQTIPYQINMNLMGSKPTFFIWYEGDEPVGCNSGFATGDGLYRSRGIYVKPEYRRRHIADSLMLAVENQAKDENCNVLWSIPRQSAIDFYESFGYKRVSLWFDEGMEFGPNCYVIKKLSKWKVDKIIR